MFPIRVFGDPVLRQRAAEIEEIDAKIVRLSEEMIETMYAAPGVGLAAPQVGIERRIFVYDVGDGPKAVDQPRDRRVERRVGVRGGLPVGSRPALDRSSGRSRSISSGYDLEGQPDLHRSRRVCSRRVFQHELDHLDGILLLERLEKDQRKQRAHAARALPDTAFAEHRRAGASLERLGNEASRSLSDLLGIRP